MKGDRVSQCCRKLPECQMNSNYKPVDMAGTKPRKVDSAAQCFELCERTRNGPSRGGGEDQEPPSALRLERSKEKI